MTNLAIHGGSKSLASEPRRFNSYDHQEVDAASEVIQTGNLSGFLGSWSPDFYGGPKVKELESKFVQYFGVKHAISINSWTSGLITALGAVGIEPGDEVITSPWSMCATPTSIVHWGAIPVFADIDPRTFCIDPLSVEKCITNRTKAILSVDIFGSSADMLALKQLATDHGLHLISDSAQSPGALSNGQYAGCLGDIGGFSLNYHKHIHTGEGGILVTNSDELAERCRLIRNHAEAVVGPKGENNLVNMVGYNFRLGEIEAAIGIVQLSKLSSIIEKRIYQANYLTSLLCDIKGLIAPEHTTSNSNIFYIYPLVLDRSVTQVCRSKIVEALKAEGVPGLIAGYANLHRLPMYQNKIAYGSSGYPWIQNGFTSEVSYDEGICPVAEYLHNDAFIGFLICLYDLSDSDINDISLAFHKVFSLLPSL